MKAIYWKEIRENLKWAAIGFAAFSLALALAWSGVADPNNYENFFSVLSPAVIMAATLCACGFGAALGFLQILPEQRRDRWAFLVHRPVSWTTIFWGKVGAGLTLYFTAMLVPFGFLCYWASIPGHINAPFDWRMGLGGLADILSGAVFYFAGMITSLRQARWLGSKAVALAGAIWVLGAADDAVHFWAACAWIAVIGLLMLLSARGNFLRNGVYTSQAPVARGSLVALFVLGLCMLVSWAASFSRNMINDGYQYGDTADYGISKAGEPVKMLESGGQLVKVEDADGNDLHIDKLLLPSYANNLPRAQNLDMSYFYSREPGYRSYLCYMAESYQLPGTRWFYFRATRRLQSYDHDSRKLSGYITPDGYHAASDGVPSSAFPAEYQNKKTGASAFGEIVVFGTRLYLIDYLGLTVRQLAETESPSDYTGATILSADEAYDAPLNDAYVVAGLKDGLAFIKASDGTRQCFVPYEYPYTKDRETWANIMVVLTPDKLHFLVWYQLSFDKRGEGYNLPSYLYRYSLDGTQEKKWELPPLFGPIEEQSWAQHLWAVGEATGSRLYSAGDWWLGKQMGDEQAALIWKAQFVRGWDYVRVDWLVSAIVGILCAVFAIVRGRSYLLPGGELAGWAVLVFLGGIGGLLVFLAVKEWPARATCSSCAKKRMVPLDVCEHCGSPWEKPKRDGTEIFA